MSRSHLSRSVLAGLAVAGLVASLGGSPATGAAAPVGRVFMVNPVQSSGDQSLTDQKDSATAVPQTQYVDVPLTNLDGSGYLRGDWASVVSTTGKPVSSKTGYLFDRSADQFEQVMAYYWVTQAQLYIQSLGFGLGRCRRSTSGSSWCGSTSSAATTRSTAPAPASSPSPSARAAWTTPRTPRWSCTSTATRCRTTRCPASAPRWRPARSARRSATTSRSRSGLAAAEPAGWPVKAPAACVADWDSTSYTSTVPHCLRRVDGNKTVADVVGEVHADGEIWSAGAVGHPQPDHRGRWQLGGRRPDHHRRAVRLHPGRHLRRRGEGHAGSRGDALPASTAP